ncbi:flavin monoamine oxidase family protein [Algoriphagus kandeliae]|uniref:Flavin monoamine oxidase family protein n=1 Tax=Algoriphagus kandeliae TaxID=2562278 RepID=A0A4Y9QRL7_9BACT|nr:flavin monoamine oxidase family protein [Algoriphagus kandeliae]TFV94252.1 flavin monoamine oxidase family protein [Algoriphagus kandeliae]
MKIPKTEVIIVGAGFSGIAAAKKLFEAGISFKILEARDRIGGRVYTNYLKEDLYVDLGGQWIGPTQDRMYELCKEYGISYFETYDEGKNILNLRGKIRTYKGIIPKMDPVSLINLDILMRKMERMARQINVHTPWSHPKAQKWDQLTLEDFLRKNSKTKSCYEVIKIGCETIFACELHEISLLHALFYIRSGKSLDCLINIQGGAQQHRIEGGMQRIAEAMATPFRDHIIFNSPVEKVIQSTDHTDVISGENRFSSNRVILAVPPPLLKKIHFEPGLSSEKSELLDNYAMGRVGKCFMIYQTPFWREDSFSGQVVSDDPLTHQTLFDCSTVDGKYGILMGFTIGNRADEYFGRSEEDRKKRMISQLVQYFGEKAKDPIQYIDFTMSDETWSQGCYAGLMPVGAWTTWREAYRKPEGNLHFAGTEAATVWHGYIEGAVRAGEAAALEIIKKKNKEEA